MSLCSTKHSNGYFIQSKKPKSLSVLKMLREERFHDLSAAISCDSAPASPGLLAVPEGAG